MENIIQKCLQDIKLEKIKKYEVRLFFNTQNESVIEANIVLSLN